MARFKIVLNGELPEAHILKDVEELGMQIAEFMEKKGAPLEKVYINNFGAFTTIIPKT